MVQQVYTLLVEVGRARDDGLPKDATGAALVFDDRLMQGQNIWMKTLRFQLALAVYLLTLSAYARWLPSRIIAHPRHRLAAWVVVLAGIVDLVAIAGPAAAGSSHRARCRS